MQRSKIPAASPFPCPFASIVSGLAAACFPEQDLLGVSMPQFKVLDLVRLKGAAMLIIGVNYCRHGLTMG
ncbi:hypothetical protein [Ensifer aridi]|uniref:hypothetical protein n=1 Tax=Ensifer aridi TaxID=1708715 RepID=UPI000428A0CD|nr:hypothetical protein [Ensifer aridi]